MQSEKPHLPFSGRCGFYENTDGKRPQGRKTARRHGFSFAVYLDNVIIGFIMFGYYESKQQYTLWKFLIDKNYQNMGHGKKALQQGLLILKKCSGAGEVFADVALGNDKAKRLYASVGFRPTGLIENNMEEMKYCYE